MSRESEGRSEVTPSFNEVELEEGPSNALVYSMVISSIIVFILELIWLIYEVLTGGSEILYLLITLPMWILIITTFITTKKILTQARKYYDSESIDSKVGANEPPCAGCGKTLSLKEFRSKPGKLIKPVKVSRSRIYLCKKCYKLTWLRPRLMILLLFLIPWHISVFLYYMYTLGSIEPVASIFAPIFLILLSIIIPAVTIFNYVDFRRRYP